MSESSKNEYFEVIYVIWRNDEFKKYIKYDNGIKVVNYFNKVMIELKDIIFNSDVLINIDNYLDYQFISIGHRLCGSVAALILYEGTNK